MARSDPSTTNLGQVGSKLVVPSVAALRAIRAAMDDGEWFHGPGSSDISHGEELGDGRRCVLATITWGHESADAAGIVAIANALPALLEVIEQQAEALRQLVADHCAELNFTCRCPLCEKARDALALTAAPLAPLAPSFSTPACTASTHALCCGSLEPHGIRQCDCECHEKDHA